MIHGAALDLLESVGIADSIDSWRETVISNGGWLTDEGRLCYPRGLVTTTLPKATRKFTLYARDPVNDLDISDKRVHLGGCSGAVYILDIGLRTYREARLIDLYDQVRLEDALENMHFILRPAIARDMRGTVDLDVNTAYACMAGTSKHFGTSFSEPETVDMVSRMADLSLGGNGDGERLRERPFFQVMTAFVVPPLRFAPDACRVFDAAIRNGLPVNMIAAGQAGATAPVTLLGSLVQTTAEQLAAITYVNLIAPGHPVLVGHNALVSDLRTGACVGGCAEMGLLAAAAAQICQFYGLPSSVFGGVASSKLPDVQSGWERGYTTTLAALSGANLISQAAGGLGDFMMSSFEAFTIDNDMIGEVLRAVRGIDISGERLARREIDNVIRGGEGHFLSQPQTLELMDTEYYYPSIADRGSLKDWQEQGSQDMRERAIARTIKILKTHYPHHIDPSIDEDIRKEFAIYLSSEHMRPGEREFS